MKHLLLDDEGIELQDGLERRWHQPVKHGPPVLAPEGPLEMPRLHIWNPPLPADDGGWRMWYIGGEGLHPLHATSADGIEWSRPKLRLVESGGGGWFSVSRARTAASTRATTPSRASAADSCHSPPPTASRGTTMRIIPAERSVAAAWAERAPLLRAAERRPLLIRLRWRLAEVAFEE